MHIVVHAALSEIDTNQWNKLVADNNPFLRHEFLKGLEISGCVNPSGGWQPSHLAVYADKSESSLMAAMPCYIKDHSYGEYIFDWSWADAYFRHGLDYYPKLSNAIPFTPATGERILIASGNDRTTLTKALLTKAQNLIEEKNLSGLHILYANQEQSQELAKLGIAQRLSNQFHWHNKGYDRFDDFLAALSSKKRKNIKRERRRVKESGVSYQWLNGNDLDKQAAATLFGFYQRTIRYYGGQLYLNLEFFEYLVQHFAEQTLFLFAHFEGVAIAGGLYFKSDNTLYGRYWGALNNFHSVHFETCYYQAIEWCIRHNYSKFEAGAQGEHKLARGLEPTTTYSNHWIAHPEFRQAIDQFLNQEQSHTSNYQKHLESRSPFKHATDAPRQKP